MTHALRKIGYSCTLLLILLTAIIGQQVHIFTEDPLHFAAHCGDLLPDTGAQSSVVEKCVVDTFCFYPCVCTDLPHFTAYFIVLETHITTATCSKLAGAMRLRSLRAPPATV
ncbi:MAG: hypothetical protein RR996_04065 [Alistipes sp.]